MKDMKEIFSEAVRVGLENDTFLFLSDFREANIQLSLADIYLLPRILSNTTDQLGVHAGKLKRAILFTPHSFGESHFAELVANNEGQSARFFQNSEEATKWLFEK